MQGSFASTLQPANVTITDARGLACRLIDCYCSARLHISPSLTFDLVLSCCCCAITNVTGTTGRRATVINLSLMTNTRRGLSLSWWSSIFFSSFFHPPVNRSVVKPKLDLFEGDFKRHILKRGLYFTQSAVIKKKCKNGTESNMMNLRFFYILFYF